MIFLDSTFIIDFLRNDSDATDFAERLRDQKLATTAVNTFELMFGILRKKNIDHSREIQGLMNFISNVHLINLDYKSSVRASEIAAELVKKGMEIEVNDCLIAGIILANNFSTIITRDKEHFKRIKGIKVESY